MIDLHRIPLDEVGRPGEWVDVPAVRSFGMRREVQGALTRGDQSEYEAVRARLYFKRWSFPDSLTPEEIDNLDDLIVAHVLRAAEDHYRQHRERIGRTAADRKSAEDAARESAGAPGDPRILVGDRPGGGAAAGDADPARDWQAAGVVG